ncbi:Putative NTF2-like domain superfamily protein [Septoria linicola]|uniref:NTF2-like domain superfamily protein n=1 Tax=Septoria linicola TaxID=215465 RepID=A0A9Q9EJ84_9PEZI|nr:Putative NTF2-like domain superfamily protein [Septoria linicola]
MTRIVQKSITLQTGQTTEAYLEAIVQSWADAANARDFSPASPLWQHRAHFYQHIIAASGKTSNLSEMRENWDYIAHVHKHYTIRMVDMYNHINTDSRGMVAQVMTNTVLEGVPLGVERRNVTMITFRLVEGVWLGVFEQTLPGLDSSGP